MFRHWGHYQSISEDEFQAAFQVPSDLGHYEAVHIPGVEMHFTWTRTRSSAVEAKLAQGHLLDRGDWTFHDDGRLWVVDMAAQPGARPMAVGKLLSKICVHAGLCATGELIFFHRTHGRVGWITGREIEHGRTFWRREAS